MFRRRRSASHQQPLSSSATLSAQTAASHAFLNSQPSSSSLSSAAAAAALRSLTPTPTPVESVQTKRMVQRRTSVTSQNSGFPNPLRPSSRDGLRRARSSSSMSSRTFRDPSPRGPNAGRNSGTPPLPPPPPVPSIPPVHGPQSSSRPLPRRSASVGPSPSRSVSSGKRPASSGGRGASVEPDGRLSTVPELQRAGSRNSINFSYPMNSRPNSPSWDSDRRDASTGVSLAGQLAASEIPQRQSSVSSQTANTSARRTTRVPSEQGSPGRAVLPVGTAVAAAQAAVVPRTEESAASSTSSSPRAAGRRENPVREAALPEPKPSPRAVVTKPKEPVVVEDIRKEEPARVGPNNAVAETAPAPPAAVPAAIPVGAPVGAPEGTSAGRVTPDRAKVMAPPTPDRTKSTPSSSVLSSPESMKSDSLSPETQSPRRQPSSSPGRSARFSSRLAITGFGEHLHQPPPRSVSPAKSAMKNSRKSSLSPDGRTTNVLRPGPPLSELSDATSVASDDGSKPATRRKQVKVSFDDEAEVVGVAASPPTSPEEIAPSPPSLGKARTKGSWFGVVKRKPVSNDLGEVLTPRPALPSFGSIRGGRNGRPLDHVQDDLSDNESIDSSESSPISFSHDHALAGILTNAPSREAQKASTMDRSTSPAAASTIEPSVPAYAPGSGVRADADSQNVRTVTELSAQTHQAAPARKSLLAAPDITVQPATPELEQGRSSLDWYTVPGGFPRSSLEYDPSKRSGIKPYQAATADDLPHLDDGMETDDESGESIYSDAEEGFAEDNFGSINAIVDDRPAAGPPRAAAQGHQSDTQRTNEERPDLPELPETCQIARAFPSAREVTVAEILESNQQPFPFAATDSPPLGSRPTVRNNSTKRIPRSERLSDLAQRSASVDDYDGSAPANATSPDVNGPAQPLEVTSGASFFRQRQSKEQAKKRSLSWGPSLLKGAKSNNTGDEPSVNGKTAFPLQRPSSNGSDSSSSFKRFYRPRADSQHSMLRTLRAAPPSAPAQSSKPTSASTTRPRSSGLGSGSMPATLRTSEPRREKPSFFSTGKIQKSRSSNAAFASRFADSDDEAGNATTPRWKSRYADSSDEERGAGNLRPVRGIPRRQGTHDGDSTELEDSSDNNDNHRHPGRRRRRSQSTPAAGTAAKRQLHKPNAPGNGSSAPRNPAFAAVAKSRGMTEDELEEFMHHPGTGRRSNSILRRFSIRKSKSPPPPGRSLAHAPGSVIHEADTPHDGTHSNGITTTITANNGATPSSKLKKRGVDAADNWPLQSQTNGETMASASRNAPTAPTTNGVGRNGSAAVESITSEADHAAPSTVGESEKLTGEGRHLSSNRESGVMDVGFGAPRKKRFPRLRKAFGLH